MIELYSHGGPNGHKVSILLEELGLPYEPHDVNVFAGEGREEAFLALNPNGKVPVIRDTDTGRVLTESNAILLYLADRAGRLMPAAPERWEAMELLFLQASGQGPMFGQRAHFDIMAPETVPYAIERYAAEGERLTALLDARLAGREWFQSDYSVVDIAFFGWSFTAAHMGYGLDGHPNLQALARPRPRTPCRAARRDHPHRAARPAAAQDARRGGLSAASLTPDRRTSPCPTR